MLFYQINKSIATDWSLRSLTLETSMALANNGKLTMFSINLDSTQSQAAYAKCVNSWWLFKWTTCKMTSRWILLSCREAVSGLTWNSERQRSSYGDATHFQQQLINFFRPTSTKYYMRVSRLHIVNYIFWNVCGAFAKLALQLYLTIHMHQMEEKCCRTKLHKYYNPSMTAFQPKTLQVFYSVIPQ